MTPASLSLDEKIGQLFIATGNGVFMNERSPEYRELVRRVRDLHLGGIHWYLSDVYETAWLNRRLQALAKVPLLISADLEAGVGMRFEGTTYWPWPMAVSATGDPGLAERQGRATGEEARALGLNQIDAPVADVNLDPDNPIINVRSYGEDPEEAARFVAAFVRGVQSAGVIATVKHFPGHGDTRGDSHRSLPVLSASRERLERIELVPFRAAIAAGARAVMTAHLAVPALDATPAPARPEGASESPYARDPSEVTRDATAPASLSFAVTEGLLRRELGFDGLVVTDAADMGALLDHYDPGETAVRAILAGADQIPKSPDLDAAIAAVRHAVESGRISRERLDRSVARILAAKRWAGSPAADPERIFRVVDSPEHRALAEEIALRSLTLVREEPGALPLGEGTKLVSLTVTDGPEGIGSDLARELRIRLGEEPPAFVLGGRSSEAEIAPILEAASAADTVLVALFLRVQSGRGSIALPPAGRLAVERLLASGTRVVAVSFGTPYLLRDLPGLKTYLAVWGSQTDVQVAVARALFGEAAITGRLPVTIPGTAPRGAGIQKPAEKRS
ncbi:MAG: glycoside hydrolase family 3 protein [Thermoanaerobaculia bacterium]